DDEPEARQIISTVITRTGAEVKACTSASEALAKLVEWKPDVILSDIARADEDGYIFINKVRSLRREKGGDPPAAALTAYARDIDRRQALAAGYHAHHGQPSGASPVAAFVGPLRGAG